MTALAAKDLSVRRGGRALLDGVTLCLRPGELVGIVGPNGAGKSTLLRCLAGLILPENGDVLAGGVPVRSLSSAERARLIGYVPQRFEPAWDYSVREMLDMGASRAMAPPGARATAVEENELEPLLERRWSRLSGGERARALLASVTVTRPPILLADEPGASLDVRHRHAALRRLRSYAEGGTVAVVLHELDLALRFCDRLIVLDGGRVALDAAVTHAATSPVLDQVFGVTFERLDAARGEAVPLVVGIGR